MSKKLRLAVDVDGVIFEKYWEQYEDFDIDIFGSLVSGARETLRDFKRDGHEILIHTTRTCVKTNPFFKVEELYHKVKAALDQAGVPYDEIWVSNGKPHADVYIDDRGARFEGDWKEIKDIIKFESDE